MSLPWVFGWLAVIIVAGGIRLAITIHDSRAVLRAIAEEERVYGPYLRAEGDAIPVRDGMPSIAMRTGMAWPAGLCAWPPCEWEADWTCTWHDPRGQRLQYGPEPVVALPEPDDPWWTR